MDDKLGVALDGGSAATMPTGRRHSLSALHNPVVPSLTIPPYRYFLVGPNLTLAVPCIMDISAITLVCIVCIAARREPRK